MSSTAKPEKAYTFFTFLSRCYLVVYAVCAYLRPSRHHTGNRISARRDVTVQVQGVTGRPRASSTRRRAHHLSNGET